jgi:hypothetical protein
MARWRRAPWEIRGWICRMAKLNRNLALRQVCCPGGGAADGGKASTAAQQPRCSRQSAKRQVPSHGLLLASPHPAANRLHVAPWACNDGAGGGWFANLGTGWAWTRRLDEAHRFRDRHLPNRPRPLHPSQPHVVPVPVIRLAASRCPRSLVSHVVAVSKDWRLQHLIWPTGHGSCSPYRGQSSQNPRIQRGWMDGCMVPDARLGPEGLVHVPTRTALDHQKPSVMRDRHPPCLPRIAVPLSCP